MRCLLLLLLPFSLFSQSIVGDWYGTLDAMGTKLPLVLHLDTAEGVFFGTMDSPSQNAYGIEMDEVRLDGNQFFFFIEQLGAKFTATVSELGLNGDFNQAGFDFPMTFTRNKPAANGKPSRAQEPSSFPYEREQVTFSGGGASVTLAGELTYPSSGPIRQAVILISGSGGQDRNSDLGEAINHRPFLVLSDFLTRQGIAVLRYDDRGIAKSTGEFTKATTADFAEDAAAAFHFLRSKPQLKDAAIGIIGHSEGGMIAPMVASETPEVDFLVLLAAPGVAIDTLMLTQSRLIQSGMGAPEVIIERNLRPVRKAYAYIKSNPDLELDALTAGVQDIFKEWIKELPAPLQASITDQDAFAKQQSAGLTGTWFRYFLSFDPTPFLQAVKVPVLAMNGELDTQVPADPNLFAIADKISSNGNQAVTIVPIPGLNHLFQAAETGNPVEYGQIEETFNPAALRILAGWITEQQ